LTEEVADLTERIRVYRSDIKRLDPLSYQGKVERMVGLIIEARGPSGKIGELCEIHYDSCTPPLLAEVVGFRSGNVLLMPLSHSAGIGPGSDVLALGKSLSVPVGSSLMGRVLDGLGNPVDGGPNPGRKQCYSVESKPPHPLERRPIDSPIGLGIKAIDGLLTCGKGQRLGIFAGSGVGKSVMMGMIARYTEADVNVIALVGERGREVREFIEKDLGEEGLKRSVVVVATSDEPAMIRIKAALVATAIAEYFRDQGADVLFMLDSITRFAMAQREVGLTVGEPPTTRGYPPSVFALLPRLMERVGCSRSGAITALYTVLVEGDDMNEPVADTARSILDGHIVLSRDIASRNHYPAIDILGSVSRLATSITSPGHQEAAAWLRRTMAVYREAEDLINIGAYKAGTNPDIDHAIEQIGNINSFLQQAVTDRRRYEDSVGALLSVHDQARGVM
jgi:flagellum-specific ATP synthase